MKQLGLKRFGSRRDVRLELASVTDRRVPDQGIERLEHLEIARVVRGPVHSLPILVWADPPPAGMVKRLVPLHGATFSHEVIDHQRRMATAILQLSRPVPVGETVVYGWISEFGEGSTEEESVQTRVQDAGAIIIQEIILAKPPVGPVRQFFTAQRDTEDRLIGEVQPTGGRYTATYVNAPAGQCSLRWRTR